MSQVLTIGVGGAGVNLTKAALIESAKEHGIGYDGLFHDESMREKDVNHHVLFRESQMGTWTPRSLFFDNEPD